MRFQIRRRAGCRCRPWNGCITCWGDTRIEGMIQQFIADKYRMRTLLHLPTQVARKLLAAPDEFHSRSEGVRGAGVEVLNTNYTNEHGFFPAGKRRRGKETSR